MENIGQYITNYVKGKAPKDLFEIKEDGMLPYLSPDYLRGKAEPEFYAFPNHRTVQVDEGDVIVLWDGSNAGEIFTAKNGVLASTMVKLEFDESELNQKYYAFSFQYLEYFLKAKTAGSGIPHADKGVIKKLDFFKPPKPEQTAIASILSKVDEAIEATQNSIKAAEKLKKALMQNLLTGKLKPDGTWRTEEEFYVDEKFGKVPVGWQIKPLGELVIRKTETIDPIKSKEEYDYVGLEHIEPGKFIRNGKGKSNETLAIKVIFKKGDLLYGKLRPYLNKVWLADISGVGSTEFLVFAKGEYTKWIYFVMQSKNFLDFTQSVTAGTQHPRASFRDVKRFPVILPKDIDEINEISDKIISTEKYKVEKQAKIKTLQRLKKSLMQNLLTGKVRVDVTKINELLKEQENE